MRIKAKYIPRDPEPGETRVRRVFAWTPKNIDGTIVFLEFFEILESFITSQVIIILNKEQKKAIIGNWQTISIKTID